jgi:predicted transcriptional regulator
MDRPRAQLAARAIAEYVQRNAWHIAAIKEGIGQLDAGHSYDFDEVLDELDEIITQEEKAREG